MMTGQRFDKAYAAVESALGCATRLQLRAAIPSTTAAQKTPMASHRSLESA
jgi:hypothetical protein